MSSIVAHSPPVSLKRHWEDCDPQQAQQQFTHHALSKKARRSSLLPQQQQHRPAVAYAQAIATLLASFPGMDEKVGDKFLSSGGRAVCVLLCSRGHTGRTVEEARASNALFLVKESSTQSFPFLHQKIPLSSAPHPHCCCLCAPRPWRAHSWTVGTT